MKKVLLSLTMLAIMSTPVLAKSPVANLKINGDIKPPTCTINGATQSDVLFDYGRISPSLIPQSKIYSYSGIVAHNVVTVECDAKTYLTFVASDTYGDTELSVNNTSEWFHLVDKAILKIQLERLISYGVMLRSMVNQHLFHGQTMLQLQEKATTTSYTKGQLMVGHQNNNQVLIKMPWL